MINIKTNKKPWMIRIYKVISTALNSDWCYVGQTKQTLEKRWESHESDFRKWIRTDKSSKKFMWFDKAIELQDLDLKTFKIELLEEARSEAGHAAREPVPPRGERVRVRPLVEPYARVARVRVDDGEVHF